jgi:hypothetical protein
MLTPQELEDKYASKIAIRKCIESTRPLYIIEVQGRRNGVDNCDTVDKFDKVFTDKIQVKTIFKNELFFLLICYLYAEDYEFCSDSKEEEPPVCGFDFAHDVNFPWLKTYLEEIDMCTEDVDTFFVTDIYWRDADGTFLCILPDMSDLFETRDEMIDYINNLYNATRSN